jgi:O-antigen/teichoic acid export membrane protein
MNLKKLAGNTLWMAISRIGMALVKFITVPMLLHYYGKESFGLIALALSLNAYLHILSMGLPSGIVRFVSIKLGAKDHEGLGRLSGTGLTLYLLIGLVNALIMAGFGFWGAQVFNVSPEQVIILRRLIFISAISSFFYWIGTYLDELLIAAEEIAWNSRLQICQVVLEFCAVVFITQSGLSFGVEVYLILSLMIPAKIMRWKRHASLMKSLVPVWDWKVFRPVFSYSVWMLLFSVCSATAIQLRPLVLGIRAENGAAAAAEYRILFGIAQFALMGYAWVATPLLPAMSKAYGAGNREVVADVIQSMSKVVWIILGAMLFGFFTCARPLLSVYVGQQYEYLSVPLSVWLIVLSANLFLGPIAVGVMTTGRVKRLAAFTLVSTVVSLTALWVLSPVWGLRAAIAAIVIHNFLQFTFYCVLMVPKLIGNHAGGLILKSYLPVLAAGLFCAYASQQLTLTLGWESQWAQLFFSGIVFCILYAAVIFGLVCPLAEIKRRIGFLRGMAKGLQENDINASAAQ